MYAQIFEKCCSQEIIWQNVSGGLFFAPYLASILQIEHLMHFLADVQKQIDLLRDIAEQTRADEGAGEIAVSTQDIV